MMINSSNIIVILRVVPVLLSVVAVELRSVIPAKSHSNKSHFEFDGSNSGYIITAGGCNPQPLTSAYALDLYSGEWTDLPQLPKGLCGFNLVLRDSSVYAVGGQSASGSINSTLLLSMEEMMWKTGSDLIYSNGRVLTTAFNGSIFAVGGHPYNNVLQAMGCNGGWRRLAPSIYDHMEEIDAITVLNDKIYVQGSHHQDEVYDPSTDTWTAIHMTNQDRCGAGIVALNGYIYIIGGADAKNERYDPASGEITYFEACLFNSVQFAAVVTDGEKIYVLGGVIAGDYSNKVQMYSPDLDMWQSMTQYPVVDGYMGAVFVKELPTD